MGAVRRTISIFTLSVTLLASSVVANAQDEIEVRMGWQPGVQILFFIARAEGFFEDAGLDPEYLRFNAGPPMFSALRTGDIDFAAMGAPPAVTILSQEPSVRMFLIGADESRAERLVVRPEAGISDISDLKGKTIGVWRGTSAEFALERVLEKANLKRSDVEIPDLDATALIAAFKKGSVDGVHVWDPWAMRLQEAGGKTLIRDADVGVTLPDPWLARKEFLEETEGGVRIVEATDRARQFLADNPERSAEILAETLELELGQAKRIIGRMYYPTMEEQYDPSTSLSLHPDAVSENRGAVGVINEIADFLDRAGKLDSPPDMRTRTDPGPLDTYMRRKQ